MRKFICILLCAIVLAGSFAACGTKTADDEKIKIITTVFPEYDWVIQVLGEKADGFDVTLLLNNGVDLHSYQPTASDMIKISTCDLFVYVGGESDGWVDDALSSANNENMKVVNLLEMLGDAVRKEETVEGMEEEEEEEEEGEGYDEHVWLSLRNAKIAVEGIAETVKALDPENAAVYDANAAAYTEKINDLDLRYSEAAENAKMKTLIFCDRFPFLYLTKDYGLEYYAAFSGCSAESEASFKTVTFLAKKVDELKASAVIALETSDGKLAETVISATEKRSVKILRLDSMQSVSSKDMKSGLSYLSVMEKNLDVLKEALA